MVFLSKKEGFTSGEIQELTGLTNRNLQYWDEEGVFSPSIQRASGKGGLKRLYSTLDVAVLQAVVTLKRKGMSFQKIRKTLEYLRKAFGIERPFHEALSSEQPISLLTDGVKNFYLCRGDQEVLDVLKAQGQYLLLPLSDLVKDLQEKLREFQRVQRAREQARARTAA